MPNMNARARQHRLQEAAQEDVHELDLVAHLLAVGRAPRRDVARLGRVVEPDLLREQRLEARARAGAHGQRPPAQMNELPRTPVHRPVTAAVATR